MPIFLSNVPQPNIAKKKGKSAKQMTVEKSRTHRFVSTIQSNKNDKKMFV